LPTVPKRSEQRTGHRSKAEKARTTKAQGAGSVPIPAADPSWEPLALEFYESLAKSGQRVFYEPSDWVTAKFVCDVMSRALRQKDRISSQLVATLQSLMGDLLTTEAARRRCHVELDRLAKDDEPASVSIMARYRAAADAPKGAA
jgi:hypothetical protein